MHIFLELNCLFIILYTQFPPHGISKLHHVDVLPFYTNFFVQMIYKLMNPIFYKKKS